MDTLQLLKQRRKAAGELLPLNRLCTRNYALKKSTEKGAGHFAPLLCCTFSVLVFFWQENKASAAGRFVPMEFIYTGSGDILNPLSQLND